MINSPPKRRGPGRPFKPGQSGNPGGKIRTPEARKALMDMRQLARGYSEEALGKLVQLMRGVVKVGRKSIPVPIHTQGRAAAEKQPRRAGRCRRKMAFPPRLRSVRCLAQSTLGMHRWGLALSSFMQGGARGGAAGLAMAVERTSRLGW